MQYDPNALTQTGPGMPNWLPFETFNFSWSGPVTRDQMVSFTLIGPKTNLVLAFSVSFLLLSWRLACLAFDSNEGTVFISPA